MTPPGPSDADTKITPGARAPASPLPATVASSHAVRRFPFVLPPPTDRYELGEEIARGGMGAVHRARDKNLDRELALKVLLPRFANSPQVVARFVEEALIGGQLQHPGLVPVHELGTLPDGRPFIALKLIKGRTFADILAERRTPADDLPLRLGEFKQVCRAVGYAHEHRVIHRDLKPGNVMVGKHGEVQVMDWGVAKFLSEGAEPEPEPAADEAPATEITAPRSDGIDSNTQAGDVLGTPPYMSPEQARGQIAAVSERSDVFGLGAILCELLTGQPPYLGPSRDACRVQSLVADVAPVHARLDACGADPALVALAKRCLDPDPALRPADAGALADEIEAHLAGVQLRLERAEVARAAAQVRAAEERKRRRVQLALFAAVFGIVVACGAGFALVREQRVARAAQTARLANEAVGRMESLRDQAAAVPIDDPVQRARAAALWADALAAAEQVEGVDGETFAGPVADVRARAADAEKQRRTLAALEDAREAKVEIDDADFTRVLTAKALRLPFFHSHTGVPRYERAFRDYGIDVDALSAEDAAARVAGAPIAARLVAALDDWYCVRPEDPRAGKLLAVAGRADPDPVRGRIRDAIARNDRKALAALATAHPDLPPPTALLLAFGLEEYKNLGPSAAVLERAVRKHPGDFWVQHMLSMYLGYSNAGRLQDAARAALAAVALRPTSYVALIDAADALSKVGRHDEAIEYALRAVEARPDLTMSHVKLFHAYGGAGRNGDALRVAEAATARFPHSFQVVLTLGYAQGYARRWAAAERTIRRTLAANPGVAHLHLGLAFVLAGAGRTGEAEAAIAEARRLGSAHPFHEVEIGQALAHLGRHEPAIAAFREALEREPSMVEAQVGLAGSLVYAERYPEAVEAARTAVRMNPDSHHTLVALSTALRYVGANEEALEHARAAGRLAPRVGFVQNEIGLCLQNLHRYAEAEAAYRAALAADPSDPTVWTSLGRVIRENGDPAAAAEVLAYAVSLDPGSADTRREFGMALQHSDRAEEAIAAYRAAVRLNPKASSPHNDLGIVLEKLGRGSAALAAYKAAVDLEPNDEVIQTNYGDTLARLGRKEEAEAAFRAAIAHKPNYARAYRELFELLNKEGAARRLDATVIAVTWTGVEPSSANAHNAVGNSLYAAGLPKGAVTAYQRAVELRPEDAVLNANLAGALEQTGRHGDAAVSFRRAWDLAPENGEYAAALIRVLTLAGEFDAADKAAAEAIKKLPESPVVRAAVAVLRVGQKNLVAAEAELRRALEIAPTEPDYSSALGRLLDKAGRSGEAIALYRQAVGHGGWSASAPLTSALMAAGHPADAVAAATAGLRTRAGDFTLLGLRGRARFNLRDYADSIADLTAALRAAEGRTDVTAEDRGTALLWLAQSQYLAGRYPDALASARAVERLVPGTDDATFAARLAAHAADALRFEVRADEIKAGTFRPKANGEKIALATYLVVADREPALAFDLFAEALAADPKLAADDKELHRYNAARAAGRANAARADDPAAAARRARALAWLSAEWAATPGANRGRRAGIWLRDPALAPVRDDAALGGLGWFERCAWRVLWDDVRRATALPAAR